jgi:hypothetical protein
MSFVTIVPTVGVQTPFSNRGIGSRGAVGIFAGPAFIIAKTHLSSPVYSGTDPMVMELQNTSTPGVGGSISVRAALAVTNDIEIGVTGSFNQFFIDPIVFDDRSIRYSGLSFFASLRLLKDKNFRYATP